MSGVRMGEIALATVGTELVALGLGSCIGLAIVDWSAGVAGLAHVVLPESGGRSDEPGKFADTAVPELLRLLARAGARRLEAAMAGGARMFQTSGGLDIGARNEQAVRAALSAERITVRAAQTGGGQGRTIRVSLADGLVTVRVAGEQPVKLIESGARAGSSPGASASSRGGRPAATARGGGQPQPPGVRAQAGLRAGLGSPEAVAITGGLR